MEAMAQMPDNLFDLSIVDPPYGIGNWQKKYRKNREKALFDWNKSIPEKKYFEELKRVSKHQIIWGANYFNCFETGGSIVWNKRVPEKSNLSVCEIASCSLQKKVSYIDLIWQNVNRTEKIIHPCQKPIELYTWLLSKYAKKNWRILDTHLGSGSSAIACYKLGFEFYGYEIDKSYFKITKKRIEYYKRQVRMFA
tara:strand:- start:1331 stop:1915 length:585 start_codon:yes stop_codon:yes gene_type:complete